MIAYITNDVKNAEFDECRVMWIAEMSVFFRLFLVASPNRKQAKTSRFRLVFSGFLGLYEKIWTSELNPPPLVSADDKLGLYQCFSFCEWGLIAFYCLNKGLSGICIWYHIPHRMAQFCQFPLITEWEQKFSSEPPFSPKVVIKMLCKLYKIRELWWREKKFRYLLSIKTF